MKSIQQIKNRLTVLQAKDRSRSGNERRPILVQSVSREKKPSITYPKLQNNLQVRPIYFDIKELMFSPQMINQWILNLYSMLNQSIIGLPKQGQANVKKLIATMANSKYKVFQVLPKDPKLKQKMLARRKSFFKIGDAFKDNLSKRRYVQMSGITTMVQYFEQMNDFLQEQEEAAVLSIQKNPGLRKNLFIKEEKGKKEPFSEFSRINSLIRKQQESIESRKRLRQSQDKVKLQRISSQKIKKQEHSPKPVIKKKRKIESPIDVDLNSDIVKHEENMRDMRQNVNQISEKVQQGNIAIAQDRVSQLIDHSLVQQNEKLQNMLAQVQQKLKQGTFVNEQIKQTYGRLQLEYNGAQDQLRQLKYIDRDYNQRYQVVNDKLMSAAQQNTFLRTKTFNLENDKKTLDQIINQQKKKNIQQSIRNAKLRQDLTSIKTKMQENKESMATKMAEKMNQMQTQYMKNLNDQALRRQQQAKLARQYKGKFEGTSIQLQKQRSYSRNINKRLDEQRISMQTQLRDRQKANYDQIENLKKNFIDEKNLLQSEIQQVTELYRNQNILRIQYQTKITQLKSNLKEMQQSYQIRVQELIENTATIRQTLNLKQKHCDEITSRLMEFYLSLHRTQTQRLINILKQLYDQGAIEEDVAFQTIEYTIQNYRQQMSNNDKFIQNVSLGDEDKKITLGKSYNNVFKQTTYPQQAIRLDMSKKNIIQFLQGKSDLFLSQNPSRFW